MVLNWTDKYNIIQWNLFFKTPLFKGHQSIQWTWNLAPGKYLHYLFICYLCWRNTSIQGKGTLFFFSGDTLVLRAWLTTKRVDKLKCTLIIMIAAFTTRTISHLNWCNCTCRDNNATICWRKVNCVFYLAVKKMITAADSRT